MEKGSHCSPPSHRRSSDYKLLRRRASAPPGLRTRVPEPGGDLVSTAEDDCKEDKQWIIYQRMDNTRITVTSI